MVEARKATRDDLLEALREYNARVDNPRALTRQEIQDLLGVCESTAIARIRKLVKAGVLKSTRVPRENILGQISPVAAYELAG